MTLLQRAKSLDVKLALGLDDALIGLWSPALSDRPNNQEKVVAVYSIDKIIKQYMDNDGMTEDEALDFFSYNVVDAFTENHPIFIEE